MATGKDFLNYLIEQLSGCDDLTFRPMMGEYLVYYKGKLVGDICNDRLLIKPVEGVKNLLPDAEMRLPYDGAKTPMVLIDDVDDGELLIKIFETAYAELPAPKAKTKRK